MIENLAKAMFVKLGGRLARPSENPQREVWVLKRPASTARPRRRPWRVKPAVSQQKNLRKAFYLARMLSTYRTILAMRLKTGAAG